MKREKAVYDALNMLNFDVTKKCLVGEGWCPIFARAKVVCSISVLCASLIFILPFTIYTHIPFCLLFRRGAYTVSLCGQLQEALQRATYDSSSQVGIIFHLMDTVESPPTYFRTNQFTNAFQEIVDAYG